MGWKINKNDGLQARTQDLAEKKNPIISHKRKTKEAKKFMSNKFSGDSLSNLDRYTYIELLYGKKIIYNKNIEKIEKGKIGKTSIIKDQ